MARFFVTVHGEKRKKAAKETKVPFTAYNKLTPTTSWWLQAVAEVATLQ